MRVSSYVLSDGTVSYGLVIDGKVHDCGESYRNIHNDLISAIAADALDALHAAAIVSDPINASDVTFLSPIPEPNKIICIGLNYMTHIKETGREAPKFPSIFTRYPSSVIGHNEALVLPKVSDWFDYEGELAVIVGKKCRHVAERDAMAMVAGFSCFNDGSIRDYQRHTSQFWGGKNFDSSGSMGPWMVTRDEVPDPAQLKMTTRLNGETVQSTSISDLAFGIPALISYISSITTLLPGDVIATGTPSGVGLFREPKLFMKAGDSLEVEISDIGVLSNSIVAE